MVKIEKKIVGYSVMQTDAAPRPTVQRMDEHLERPQVLSGATYKVKTPLSDHALYITINDLVLNPDTEHETRQPFEIFINSKAMEHFQWIVALTRILSAVFRKGGDVTFLVEEMRSVFDPKGGYFKKGGKFMPSLVAEIAEVIEQHLQGLGLLTRDDSLAQAARAMVAEKAPLQEAESVPAEVEGAALCPKCHAMAVKIMDGCATCLNCGDSKCG